jgi:hypothetical protein
MYDNGHKKVCKQLFIIEVAEDDDGDTPLMGISLCTWSLWGWFFSQHLELLLEQLGQHLGLLLEQLGQQHLGCFVRTAGQQHLDCF